MREADGRRLVLETNRDITERKQTQESLQQAQANLARVNRVMLVGEMTASIAHEVNQPIAAAVTSAGACLRWLAAQPPDMEKLPGCECKHSKLALLSSWQNHLLMRDCSVAFVLHWERELSEKIHLGLSGHHWAGTNATDE